MNTRRLSSAPKRPRPVKKAVWVAARMVLLMLMASVAWAQQMAPGKTRNGLLRFAAARTRWLEHIFRCLLIVLRASPAPRKPAPFIPSQRASGTHRPGKPRRMRAQLLLSLNSLARGFAETGKPHPLLEEWKQRQRRQSPPACAQTMREGVPACPVDPAALLEARLAALKSVLDDPYPYAARMAAILKAAGFCARRLKPILPDGEIWAILNQAGLPPHASPAFRLRADTS